MGWFLKKVLGVGWFFSSAAATCVAAGASGCATGLSGGFCWTFLRWCSRISWWGFRGFAGVL
ncbi:hypothetical protein EBS02_03795 [bacterium]|nr:hypothetical protein [bacterium]